MSHSGQESSLNPVTPSNSRGSTLSKDKVELAIGGASNAKPNNGGEIHEDERLEAAPRAMQRSAESDLQADETADYTGKTLGRSGQWEKQLRAITQQSEIWGSYLREIAQSLGSSDVSALANFQEEAKRIADFSDEVGRTLRQTTAQHIRWLRLMEEGLVGTARWANPLSEAVAALTTEATKIPMKPLQDALRAGAAIEDADRFSPPSSLGEAPVSVASVEDTLHQWIAAAWEQLQDLKPSISRDEFTSFALWLIKILPLLAFSFAIYNSYTHSLFEAKIDRDFRQVKKTQNLILKELQKGRETRCLPPGAHLEVVVPEDTATSTEESASN